MATIQNDRDVLLQAASVRFVPPPLPPEIVDAIDAVKGLTIVSNGDQFHRNPSGVVVPVSIVFTVEFKLISGTVTWSVVQGSATLTGSGNTRTLAAANMFSERVRIRASLTVDGVTYIDEMDVSRVTDGAQGQVGTDGDSVDIVFRRSPAQPSTPSPSVGTPSGWYTSVDQVPPINSPLWGCLGFRQGGTGIFVWDTPVVFEGIDGLSVVELTVYRRATSTPATPTGGSFNFNTQTLTPPSLWSISVPEGTNPVYISKTITSIQGISGISPVSGWTTPVIALQNGDSGPRGSTGATGIRGTVQVSAAVSSSAWNTTTANTAITNFTGSSLRVAGDQVTLYHTAGGWAQTRYWSGTAWTLLTQIIDGNLIVTGSMMADQITAGTFTGPSFRTKASGARIELSQTRNEITFFNHASNDNFRTSIRAQTAGSGSVGLEIGTAGGSTGVQITHNLGAGPALRFAITAGTAHEMISCPDGNRVSIRIGRATSLPTHRPEGAVCYYNGWLCFSNGVNWIRSDGNLA